MHGREARLPLEIEKADAVSETTQLGDVQHTIDRLCALKDKVFSDVSGNIQTSQTKQKEQFKRRKGLGELTRIKKGDTVCDNVWTVNIELVLSM